MLRFEVTGMITDKYPLQDIKAALVKVGALNVRERNAFGMSNQPKVATFTANDIFESKAICEKATSFLPHNGFPVILAWDY